VAVDDAVDAFGRLDVLHQALTCCPNSIEIR
jgi:hypothetical protein